MSILKEFKEWQQIHEAAKFVKDWMNKDPQFDRFFVTKDNKPLGYVEVTGLEHAVFDQNGKFLGHQVGKTAALKTLEKHNKG